MGLISSVFQDFNVLWTQVEMHAHWNNDRLLKSCNQQALHVSAYAPLSSPQTMEGMGKLDKEVPNEMQVARHTYC